jgi:hypothetical protein
MWAVGIGRIEEEKRGCSRARGRGPIARAVRAAGNAGSGASPTAGKREGFSF